VKKQLHQSIQGTVLVVSILGCSDTDLTRRKGWIEEQAFFLYSLRARFEACFVLEKRLRPTVNVHMYRHIAPASPVLHV
jgi:hypothetical protein